MAVTISREGAVPAYQQIAADLRAAIADGRYPVGSRLPVERELARQYGVATMTVRHGIDVLRAEGVIASQEKRGHFVTRIPSPGPGGGGGQAGEYAEVMTQLRAVRDELRWAHQRLDRLEGLAGHQDQRAP